MNAQLWQVMKFEARSLRTSFFGWLVPTMLLHASSLAPQPSMAKDDKFATVLEAIPKEMMAAFGIDPSMSVADPIVYLAFNFITANLCAALFAGLTGAGLLAKEQNAKTSELLFVQPVTRSTIMLGKVLTGAALVVLFDVVIAMTTFITYAAVGAGDYDHTVVMQIALTTCTAHLCILGVSMLFGVLSPSPRAALPIGLGLVFGSYSLGVTSAIADSLAPLKHMSPLHAVDPATMVKTGSMNGAAMAVLVVVAVAAVVGSLVVVERKDV